MFEFGLKPARYENYRPDIDGLRAVAVLAVVGFHAEAAWLRGGFIGVDIFFVISGYLISGLIFKALARGSFTFREFYTRRVNRIFPALLTVLVFCLAVGWVIMMPGEYRSLGKHTFGGSAFISNVLLWREAGYFDSPNKPLLHLWSLAVEEQYYLVWPLAAIIIWRRRWSLQWVLASLIAASFALNLWSIDHSNSTAAFYFPVSRFWEILSGALLAAIENRRSSTAGSDPSRNAVRELAAVGGMFLIVLTLLRVDTNTPWPGWWGAAPVAAAVLLIGAGPSTWINRRILSNSAMVGVGLVSYPLYLWHWPLMVGAKIIYGGPPTSFTMSVIVCLSLLLAVATYRVVEIPIRFGARKRRSALILLAGVGVAAVVGLAVQAGIVPPRLYRAAASLDSAQRDREYPTDGGLKAFGGDLVIDSIRGTSSEAVAMIGDSHMQQYWPRVAELAARTPNFPTVLFLTYGSCPPMPDVERRGEPSPLTHKPFECDRFHKLALGVLRESRVRAVAYTAYWDNYLPKGATFLVGDKSGIPLKETGAPTDSAFRMFAREVADMEAMGKRTFIVLSNATSPAFDPVSMLPSRIPFVASKKPASSVPLAAVLERTASVTARLRKVAAESGATLIDPISVLCNASGCPTMSSEGQPLYIDNNHMRASYVRSSATFLDTIFSPGQNRPAVRR